MPSVRGSKRSLPVEISDDEGGIIVKRPARAETIGSIPNPEPTSGDTRVRDSKATANVFVPPRVPVLEIPDSQDEGDDDSADEQLPLRQAPAGVKDSSDSKDEEMPLGQHIHESFDLCEDWDEDFEAVEMPEEDESVCNSEGHSDIKDKSLPMEDVPEELDVTGADEVVVAEEVKVADPLADDRLERFRARLQHILYGLIDAAQAIPENSNFSVGMSAGVLPIGWADWNILRSFGSTDARKAQLVETLFTATPLRTRLVLGQLGWTCEDLLSLPQFGLMEKRPGVYLDVVTGPTAYEAYVGSATSAPKLGVRRAGLGARRYGHEASIRNGERKPPTHHRQVLQPGWSSNYRLLVMFPLGTANNYSLVSESTMMIFLDTFKYPGYYSTWAPPSTYDLVKKIRLTTIFPTTEYQGLNRALPARQGRASARRVKICAQCGLSSKDAPKQAFGLVDPAKPYGLGGYLCEKCRKYRARTGKDRPEDTTRGGRPKDLPVPDTCDICNKPCASDTQKARREKNGMDGLTLHSPTQRYLCDSCYRYIMQYKVDRPGIFWDTSRTWPCSNCGTEVSRNWVRDRETNVLRCSPCSGYSKDHNKANRPEKLWKPQQGKPFVPAGPRGPQKKKRSKVAPERPEGVEAS